MVVPTMVADLGEAAALRFIDFFTANIHDLNTRAAYAVAVRGFRGRGRKQLSSERMSRRAARTRGA